VRPAIFFILEKLRITVGGKEVTGKGLGVERGKIGFSWWGCCMVGSSERASWIL